MNEWVNFINGFKIIRSGTICSQGSPAKQLYYKATITLHFKNYNNNHYA